MDTVERGQTRLNGQLKSSHQGEVKTNKELIQDYATSLINGVALYLLNIAKLILERHMKTEIILEEAGLSDGQILADSIRQWRANCQAGQFTIGSSNIRGNKLEMELVGAQVNEGEFFGYPNQKWLAILFVDPDRVLSSILFKTESFENFAELRRSYIIKGESLLGKTIKAIMSKRASKSGNGYYAVEFEVLSDGKYAAAIEQFRKVRYSPNLLNIEYSPLNIPEEPPIKENARPNNTVRKMPARKIMKEG